MIFPVVMYGCERWNIEKAEWWRSDAFELWCWRRPLLSKGLSRVFQSLKAIFQRLSFFIVQLSHSYMTTGKIIALTIWTFVGKVMSLSRFVIVNWFTSLIRGWPSWTSCRIMRYWWVSQKRAWKKEVCHLPHLTTS